jgi:hypothetical protein
MGGLYIRKLNSPEKLVNAPVLFVESADFQNSGGIANRFICFGTG